MSSNYHRIQANESAILAHGLLHEPNRWSSHVERSFTFLTITTAIKRQNT